MSVDPLSEAFTLLELEAAASARFEAGGDWALRFPAKPHLKFNAVLRGHCWITLPDQPPRRLVAGDTFLLADAPPFVLASDPHRPADDSALVFGATRSAVLRHGGDETVLVGGGFRFGPGNAALLLASLPAVIHIPAGDPAAAILRGTLQVLDDELGQGRMGAALMARRLADILLVQALRAHVSAGGSAGWIGALDDRRIGAALRSMHDHPGHPWTVATLAAASGMSRSGFALRFRMLVGCPPLDYLVRWRMQVARDALRRGHGTVASLAARLGYASESAFGHAFKRVHAVSPSRVRPSATRPHTGSSSPAAAGGSARPAS